MTSCLMYVEQSHYYLVLVQDQYTNKKLISYTVNLTSVTFSVERLELQVVSREKTMTDAETRKASDVKKRGKKEWMG